MESALPSLKRKELPASIPSKPAKRSKAESRQLRRVPSDEIPKIVIACGRPRPPQNTVAPPDSSNLTLPTKSPLYDTPTKVEFTHPSAPQSVRDYHTHSSGPSCSPVKATQDHAVLASLTTTNFSDRKTKQLSAE